MAMLGSYRQVMGMGPPSVPLILEELRRELDRLSWTLESITDENPNPLESSGDVHLMVEAWIGWGSK
jgi:hypothetical protein